MKTALAVELARVGLTQAGLAKKLNVPSTTLSDWVRGEHPGPGDLAVRIERVLHLRRGALGPGQTVLP